MVVVTGGGGGIGGATCRRFAEEGALVAVLDRDVSTATVVADAIGATGGRAIAVACDIAELDAVHAAAETVDRDAARVGSSCGTVYAACKAGIVGLTKTLA